MPKLMNQLVTTSLSQVSVSTGAVSEGGGGGGITFDVAVRAEDQSFTSSYNGLSYSNVSSTQYGTFTQGITTSVAAGDAADSNSTVQWEFDTAGIYYVEFASYASTSGGGFQFAAIHRGGASNVHDEVICYQGMYSNYNRKYSSVIREFAAGDVIKFFTATSAPSSKLSRILIAKVG